MNTDQRLIDDLNRLLDLPSERRLPELLPRGASSPSRGYAEGPEPEVPVGGGIASPLTEIESTEDPLVESREYFETEVEITSTDGMITFVYQPIARLRSQDALGSPVEQVFRHPDTGDLPE